ncbi:3-keto-5-aminohexanoate cleavage protein [Natronomonas gomsonensis]|uniref:3-keto-5-aminohexanoate cleavage protein n=1 Tax=Natronomonas gomsonensis TaxID=1046043 RepID=UPI0020CA7C35|nr:3-keto-5-aminohexanoate cleavage protein [Natronomonas gomsonensis]
MSVDQAASPAGTVADTSKGNDPERAIVTAALTGATTSKSHHPGIPHTPTEIAIEAEKACEAGAAQVHIHAKTNSGEPTFEDDVYDKIYEEIRARSDVIVNFSTGAFGVPVEERTSYLRAAEPEVAALNMGSMNYGKFDTGAEEFVFEETFVNSFEDISTFAQTMGDVGIKPELECFNPGHIRSIRPLLTRGEIEPPLQFSLVLGVLGGMPATPGSLLEQVRRLPENSTWQVIGVGREQWKLVSTAVAMGGNVRVGLEDNFYLPGGQRALDNAELVSKAVAMVENVGRETATPAEARQILSLQ